MKITKTQLKKLIKEELTAVVKEAMDDTGEDNLSTLYIVPPNEDGPAKPLVYLANLDYDKMAHRDSPHPITRAWIPSDDFLNKLGAQISDPEFDEAKQTGRLRFKDFQPSARPDLEVIDASMLGVRSVDSVPQGRQRPSIPDSSNRGDI